MGAQVKFCFLIFLVNNSRQNGERRTGYGREETACPRGRRPAFTFRSGVPSVVFADTESRRKHIFAENILLFVKGILWYNIS